MTTSRGASPGFRVSLRCLRVRENDKRAALGKRLCAFLASTKPTLKPLAEMIRSNQPMPKGVRDMLAEMNARRQTGVVTPSRRTRGRI